ncbi:MAG TPA: hypothetical protein VKE98_01135 [Gemmataceae bacterium]|nr:hypothetical protein [Gemmataceae bacterium]
MLGVMYTPWWQVCAMWFSLLLAIFMLAAWIYRRKRPSILDFLTFISLIAIGIGLSIPSVARLPRAYYQEKDQFEWANIRASRKPESRQQAITALCEILKDKKNHKHTSIFAVSLSGLAEGKAKEALPTLNDLLKTLEDPYCRAQVESAIQVIQSEE